MSSPGSLLADPTTLYPPPRPGSDPAPNAIAPNPSELATRELPYSFEITKKKKNVKSKDSILNQDPQALQQFLLGHAYDRPTVLIKCTGSHEEDCTTGGFGGPSTDVVTDFDFTVDISKALLPVDAYGAPVWVVADEEPAKRGRYWRQIDQHPGSQNPLHTPADIEASQLLRRRGTHLERKQALDDAVRRRELALPPWACVSTQTPDQTGVRLLFPTDRLRFEGTSFSTIEDFSDSNLTPPTKPLIQWTEEYCTNWSPLKEFRFERTVYGWNLEEVKRKVSSLLADCHGGRNKKETVEIIIKGRKIVVRPNTLFWWLYENDYLKTLFYITFVYLIILWPIKKIMLGRCWKVAGSSFAFIRYEHLEDSQPGETVAEYVARVPQPVQAKDLKPTSRGISKVVGQRFSDWYSANSHFISSAASRREKGGERNPIVL
ncbi:hypothetical protein FS837_012452 [Tulasnella sp. UAMH 9824]|nr:hypothetical protein FS837_012452 [Tulasnella sp. UAMH 9824]